MKRQPPRYSLLTQVGTTKGAPLGFLKEMLHETMVLVGGQPRGDITGHIQPLKSKGTSDQASSSSYPSKRGGVTSNSPVTLQERCRGTTPGFCRLLGHMPVFKRFAHRVSSCTVFAWISSRNCLQPWFPVPCTFHRTRPRLPSYEWKSNPFRTKGR
jgi:hypothetical protein